MNDEAPGDLPPELRDLLHSESAWSDRPAPGTEAALARVFATLDLGLVPPPRVADASPAPASTPPPAVTPWVGAAGAVKGALLAGAFAIGIAVGAAGHATLAAPRQVVVERRVEVPVERRVEVPVERRVEVPVERRAEVPAPVVVVGAAGSHPVEVGSLTDRERPLIDQAHAALARGNTAAALVALQGHRRRFPAGVMSEDRDRLWVETLVAAGSVAEARARAADFHRRYPDSLYGARLDRLLPSAATP
jgi:hypothetical protein